MEPENKDIKDAMERINNKYGDTLKRLAEIGEIISEAMKEYDVNANKWWDELPYEQKLMAFYCVCKRIHKGDIKDRGSYRYVLYDVFGFDLDAYTIGMECGYMDIHNSIVTSEDKEKKD